MHLHPSNEVEIHSPLVVTILGQLYVICLVERKSGFWNYYELHFQPDASSPTTIPIRVNFSDGQSLTVAGARLRREPAPDCLMFGVKRSRPDFPDMMDCKPAHKVDFPHFVHAFSKILGKELDPSDAEALINFDPMITINGQSHNGENPLIYTVNCVSAIGMAATGLLTVTPDHGDPESIMTFAPINNGTATVVFDCGPKASQPEGTFIVTVNDSVDSTTTVSASWPPE